MGSCDGALSGPGSDKRGLKGIKVKIKVFR